ncbi:MAG: 4-hydroxyphenylacetate 3-hydroxylase family protein [Nocardioidaceae bacterium]
MGIRTGEEYKAGLRDDREVWIGGERIKDVTADPRMRNFVDSLAEMYDLQHDPKYQDDLTFVPDDLDERVGLSFIEPRSREDLERRRKMVKTWTDWTGGMMGRSPDFMNVQMTGYGSAHEFFAKGGEQFGTNVRNYWDYLRRNDVCLTHVFINPQTDRSQDATEAKEDTAARIVGESSEGVIVRGARMISTLAPYSDELAVMPSTYLRAVPEAEPYAFAFSIPVATPGLRFICRPPVAPADARVIDHPFGARYDEQDCVVIFDDVVVPWDRMFIDRRPDLCDMGRPFNETGTMSQMMHQFSVKNLAKAEFMLGIALAVTESIAVDKFAQVQNYLTEMVNTVEVVRSLILTSELECTEGPNGTVLPNPQPLWTVRTLFPEMYSRLVQIIKTVGASGLIMAPSVAELEGEVRDDVLRYYLAAHLPADRRIELFRLAYDVSVSSFAGRQELYERYFSGDPWRLGMTRYSLYPGTDELKSRVWGFIDRAREWDERLNENK